MADSAEGEETPEETLQQKHRREKKELQAEIQKLKSNVSKGDKKKKKDVAKQILELESELNARHTKELAELESELNARHTKELAELESQTAATSENQITENLGNLTTEDTDQFSREKRPSKAQKRRDKKAQKNREREEEIQEQEIKNLSGARNVEFNKIKTVLKEMNLQIYEIPSDGNCLYKAVAHQLNKSGTTSNNEDLRSLCAKYMKEHQDDFLPFLAKDNGDMYTEEEFGKYCDEVATTTAWGGHLEIRALSHALHQPIKIIQGEGPPIVMGEEFNNQHKSTIVLPYHRHAFGLGEHYNSVDTYVEESNEFE